MKTADAVAHSSVNPSATRIHAVDLPRGIVMVIMLLDHTPEFVHRDALIAILLEGVANMPGCLSYVVAKDPTDANAIWITEVWDSEQSHRDSLALPAVKQAITRGKPLIASFGAATITEPVGEKDSAFAWLE